MPLINFLNLTYTPSHRKVFDTSGNTKITWQLQKSVDTSKAQYIALWDIAIIASYKYHYILAIFKETLYTVN